MSDVNYFTNNTFRVLSCLYDMRGSDNIARVTQQEVADRLGISRISCNRILQSLKTEGYVISDETHVGRYTVTEIAISVIETFRKIGK